MPRHLTLAELREGLPEILRSPKDNGTLAGIVIRPEKGVRRELDSCELSLALGTHGDRWAKGCWKTTEDGLPHPDVQICIMNARCIALIAQERGNWAPAGDNLFIDLDLTPANTPPGTRLAIGTAVLEITDTPHNGCDRSSGATGARCLFVNTGDGKAAPAGHLRRVDAAQWLQLLHPALWARRLPVREHRGGQAAAAAGHLRAGGAGWARQCWGRRAKTAGGDIGPRS